MYLVMELAKGDLVHCVKNVKLSENDKLDICESAAEAVEYLHSQGVCHRDIKLENLLYVRNFLRIFLKLTISLSFLETKSKLLILDYPEKLQKL